MRFLALPLLVTAMTSAADYSARREMADSTETIRLVDARTGTEVAIVPSLGNNAYEMTVKGKKVLWSPYASLAEFKAKPVQLGNPFLAPWANRIDQDAFFANGKKYLLNPDLKNFRYDANRKPIHGLVVFAPWKVISVKANDRRAEVTSRLEFYRNPDWMAQFPFAHIIEMTYRLSQGELEVETVVDNLSSQPMPLSLGYHTYYQVADAPRDSWKVHLAAKDHLTLSDALIPTGETKPVAFPDPLPLAGNKLDDVFGGLIRDAKGRAEFWVEGGGRRVSVSYGPKYTISVVYAPPGRDFICFEPMTGVTNAFNLAHSGVYKEMQSVPSGAQWRESFWAKPSGF